MTANINMQRKTNSLSRLPYIGTEVAKQKDSSSIMTHHIFRHILADMSMKFSAQLRKERQQLEGLSFCQHKLSTNVRQELSKTIHSLKGTWRISQSASTNFIIVSADFFKQDNSNILASEVIEHQLKELLQQTLN